MKYSTLIVLVVFYLFSSIIIGSEIIYLEEKLILRQQKKQVIIPKTVNCTFQPIKIIYDMDTHEGGCLPYEYNLSYAQVGPVDFLHMPSKKERIFLVKKDSLIGLYQKNEWSRYIPFALIDDITFQGIEQAFKQRPWGMHGNYYGKSELCCMIEDQDSDTLFILDEEIVDAHCLDGDRYRSFNSNYDRRNRDNHLCTIDFRSHDGTVSSFLKTPSSISLFSLLSKMFFAAIRSGNEEEIILFKKQIKIQLLASYFRWSCLSLIFMGGASIGYSFMGVPHK